METPATTSWQQADLRPTDSLGERRAPGESWLIPSPTAHAVQLRSGGVLHLQHFVRLSVYDNFFWNARALRPPISLGVLKHRHDVDQTRAEWCKHRNLDLPLRSGSGRISRPGSLVCSQRRKQLPRSVGRESLFAAGFLCTRTTTREFRRDGQPIAALPEERSAFFAHESAAYRVSPIGGLDDGLGNSRSVRGVGILGFVARTNY